MQVNNFKLIRDFIEFESEDDFYFVQILQRAKDNKELGSNNRLIKSYYIRSKESLDKHSAEIIKICDIFKARAYIHLTKRSFKQVALLAIANLAHRINSNGEDHAARSYNTACGNQYDYNTKKWIVDIDTKDKNIIASIKEIIELVEPEGEKILIEIPTKNGVHLITKPFNSKEFQNKYKSIDEFQVLDIHKNNPTILYTF